MAIRFFSIADDLLADPAVASGAFEEIWVNSLKFKYTSMLTKAISNEGDVDLVLPVEQKSSLDLFASLFDMCCKNGTTIKTEFIPLSIGLDGHGTRWPLGGLDDKLQELCNHPLVITDQMPIPPRAPRAKPKKAIALGDHLDSAPAASHDHDVEFDGVGDAGHVPMLAIMHDGSGCEDDVEDDSKTADALLEKHGMSEAQKLLASSSTFSESAKSKLVASSSSSSSSSSGGVPAFGKAELPIDCILEAPVAATFLAALGEAEFSILYGIGDV